MGSGTSLARRNQLTRSVEALRDHLRIPLYANAYALIANQMLTSALGFLYWIVAARLYPTEVVGKNSAILSTILFVATAAELSFKAAMIRFVPRAGHKTGRLVGYALAVNLSAAFLLGLLVVTVGPHFSLTASLMESVDFWPGWLILAGMAWCVFYVQDGVLIGMRHALWVAVKNTMHSVIKIALLGLLVWLAAEYGILLSWFGPVPVLILAVQALILWRFLPAHKLMDTSQTRPVHRQEVFRSTLGDYAGSLLFESGVRILPLLVLNRLGEAQTAYYYQAWVVASPVYMLATNMASSFAVEASANMTRIGQTSRRILRQMARIIAPAVLLLWLVTPVMLYFFGPAYARESTPLLRWMLLATLPLTINTWFLNYARVTGNVRAIILVQGMTSLLAVGGSALWIGGHGIAAIGLAWLLAQTLVAMGVMARMAPALLSSHEPELVGRHAVRNQALRRADWRFFIAGEPPRCIHCAGRGMLTTSLQAAFPQAEFLPAGQDCDLAAAANPGRRQLKAMVAALRPGGLAYSEWAAWRVGGTRGILRRLRTAGLTNARFYWPLPGLDYPRLWLPLPASREACAWAARIALSGNSGWKHAVRKVLAAGLHLAASSGLTPALVCLASRPPAEELQDNFAWLRSELCRLQPSTAPEQLSFLVQTGGTLLVSKVAVMIFLQGKAEPCWVAKLPRIPEDAASLERERDVLQELLATPNDILPPDSLPRPLFEAQRSSASFFIQTALQGDPLHKTLTRTGLEACIRDLTDWQIMLARTSRRWPRTETCQDYLRRLCTDLEDLLHAHPEHAEMLARSCTTLHALRGLPMVCLHNDFTIWNVLRGPHGLRVFDWTDAERSGPPLLDLVYGLASAFLVLEKGWESESATRIYAGLLDRSSPDGLLFQTALGRYAQAVGVDEKLIAPLRLLTWMLNSRLDLRMRLFELGHIPPGYRSMYLSLWKTELGVQIMDGTR